MTEGKQVKPDELHASVGLAVAAGRLANSYTQKIWNSLNRDDKISENIRIL